MSFLQDCKNTINKTINTRISINNINSDIYAFNRYIPNKFRYYNTFFYDSYETQLYSLGEYGYCTRLELLNGTPRVWNLTKILEYTLPYENDPDADEKNLLRNQFFKFALTCEKAYIYYNNFKKTCGNYIVPWDDTFNITVNYFGEFYPIIDATYGYEYPVKFYEMIPIFYNSSVNQGISESDFAIFNTPSVNTTFTYLTFSDLIYFAIQYFVSLINISTKILSGKTPGISQDYYKYFTTELCKGYVNEYTIPFQTREKLYGFNPGFGFAFNNITN